MIITTQISFRKMVPVNDIDRKRVVPGEWDGGIRSALANTCHNGLPVLNVTT